MGIYLEGKLKNGTIHLKLIFLDFFNIKNKKYFNIFKKN